MLSRFWTVAALSAFLMFSLSATAQSELGMVLDVQGAVTAADAGKSAKVEMLTYLKPGMDLDLAPGASLTVTWYASSKEMKFSGPAKLKVTRENILVVQGSGANERSLAEDRLASGKKGMPGRLAQATIMMRSMKAPAEESISPPKGAKVSSVTPRIGWKGADDRNYRLVVLDSQGKTVSEQVVKGNAADVPAQKLAWGESYKWRASFEPGAKTAEGDFSVIERSDAERLAKIRPGANATFSDWVLYAMALEDLQLAAEARPIWKKLAAERPEQARLKQFAER